MRELCRLHNVPLPPDIDNLTIPFQLPPPSSASSLHQQPTAAAAVEQQQQIEDIESDQDEIEDPVADSEQESEIDEDLPLEMDDVRSANKVQ